MMTPDDPKLTAYALNELEDAERAEVEAFLRENEAARRFVEETRQTVAMVTGGLRSIEPPALTAEQRETVQRAAATGRAAAAPLTCGRVGRRSAFVRWSLAAAACAALVAGGYAMVTRRPPVAPSRSVVIVPPATRPDAPPATQTSLAIVTQGQLFQFDATRAHYGPGPLDGIHLLDGGVLGYSQAQFEQEARRSAQLSLVPQAGQQSQQQGQAGVAPVWAGGSVRVGESAHAMDIPQKIGGENVVSNRPPVTPRTGAVPTSPYGVGGGAVVGGGDGTNTEIHRFFAASDPGDPRAARPVSGGTLTLGSQPQPAPVGMATGNSLVAAPADPASATLLAGVQPLGNTVTGSATPVAKGAVTKLAAGDMRAKSESEGLSQQLAQTDAAKQLLGSFQIRKDSWRYQLNEGLKTVRDAVARNDGEAARVALGDVQKQLAANRGDLAPDELAEIRLQIHQAETTIPGTESYAKLTDNPFKSVAADPLSTFSIDVDTASYSNVRRFINGGQLPPADAVRIEELLNYFPYSYEKPAGDSKEPFKTAVEVAACPWNASHRLARVAIKGREIAHDKRPVSNLVFLIDVSGSMNEPRKLPLVKEGLKLMVNELTENDRVAIVVYAGAAGLVLPSTCADAKDGKAKILESIERLSAGGSTAGAQGVELAYQIATENFIKGGTNRVLLATDGDWNVGITDKTSLFNMIKQKAESGVFLSVLGFGMGNTKDDMMEGLADKGNGHYAYIDDLKEARKVLVEEMSGTLVTIAKDVKIQVEFNPAKVESYRLIGYENRALRNQDFNNDKIDAGEIGAGHCVTALYEITPVDAKKTLATTQTKGSTTIVAAEDVDPLKYQKTTLLNTDELLTLKLRYKQPDGDKSTKLETPVVDQGLSYAKASEEFKFAAAVAEYGMILRNSPHKGTATLDAVLELADEGKGKDEKGHRADFLDLVKKTKALVK